MINNELKNTLLGKDLFGDILGQESAKKAVKSALLSERHIIFVGAPGIGKTTLAKNISKLLPHEGKDKVPFVRIQGSPDLTVEDLLGDIDPIKAMKFGPLSLEAFTKGKIFKADKGILFFDEEEDAWFTSQEDLLAYREGGVWSDERDYEAGFKR